jgi:queuine tRNA-ribosyltransferase
MQRLTFTPERRAIGSKARAATLRTLHGEIKTPVFMPVGTQATVKGMTIESLKETGAQIILANTYHLLLRPGPEVFRQFGGIHNFMKWDRPVLTDSGGFQIFSLPHARAMKEEGATFQSYIDGKTFVLSPESSIEMQKAIGSDIMMVLDHCVPCKTDYETARSAMELTHRWAERSLKARGESPQALFGIVQGACHPDLRQKSAEFLQKLPFDGLAIGGLAVGETQEERYEFTGLVTDLLPDNLPRYLMGVGTPLDILEAVHRGVDMFDCIMPSQLAHRGVAFTSHGIIHFRRKVYKFSERSIDENCNCHCCQNYSRAYIHHLIKAGEALGWHLLTTHNMTYYHKLMNEIRNHIINGSFHRFYQQMRTELDRKDEENPGEPPRQKPKPKPARLGDFEIFDSKQGFSTIRQISSGEIMPAAIEPLEEANSIYVNQARLRKKIGKIDAPPLIIWDLWLGAASNVMAAINCFEDWFEKEGKSRQVNILSFERTTDPLRLATRDPDRFSYLRHSAPHKILKTGEWLHSSERLKWKLLEGDFFALLEEAEKPDIIFYDPFSPETDSELWTKKAFSRIKSRCQDSEVELITYSAADSVRVSLLLSGFYVARGVSSNGNGETTLAFLTNEPVQKHPHFDKLLDNAWLEKLLCNRLHVSTRLNDSEKARLKSQLETHPQFNCK